MKMKATEMPDGFYAVRPANQLGTCGWVDGQYWCVSYVKAPTSLDALIRTKLK